MSLYGDLPDVGTGGEGGGGEGDDGWGKAIEAAAIAAGKEKEKGKPASVPSPAEVAARRAKLRAAEAKERERKVRAARLAREKVVKEEGKEEKTTAGGGVHDGDGAVGGKGAMGGVLVGNSGSLAASVQDEYDPAKPNSYEQCVEERRRAREEEEQRHLREAQRLELERQRQELERQRAEGDGGRAQALAMSGEEAFRRRAALSTPTAGVGMGMSVTPSQVEGGGPGQDPGAFPAKPLSAAEKMMAKMGWKEGQGLGRSGQGITTPLVAKRTGGKSGVIVPGKENKRITEMKKKAVKGVEAEEEEEIEREQTRTYLLDKSRVIMMRNMVGPGQVDAELEDEVGMECSKFGRVLGLLIFEVTEPKTIALEEAVRIFVKFAEEEDARAALNIFDGRFFGGRSVRCTFFPEELFDMEEMNQDFNQEEERSTSTAWQQH